MKEPMSREQALQKARQLLGPTAEVIMDSRRSSNKIRREESIQRYELRQALKRFDLSTERRAQLQASLAHYRKLKKYFRFKIGTVTKQFRPFKIFVLVAHADSWEQCFAKIANRTPAKRTRKPAGEEQGRRHPRATNPHQLQAATTRRANSGGTN